jgi:D-glycero-alpha-D-manno-heptose-7-phosphate kinase
MLIARAPLRISLAGGGTDLPAYYERHGGAVVSTTIDKYVYVHVSPNGADHAHIASADYQTFFRHHSGTPLSWDGSLALPRAVLDEFGVAACLSVFMASEVPPGTGLGSSSTLAVALVRAVAAQLGRPVSLQEVAELACHVELNRLKAPIGKQDQFAAAFGGFNYITFSREGVSVERIRTPAGTLELLERRLLLFFTGSARDSAVILKEQQRATAGGESDALERLHRIRAAADTCRRLLEFGDLDAIGWLLTEGWRQKRVLAAGITTPRIDEAFEVALASGALGGKITGAGGGGFLLLYCHEARQGALTDAMEKLGLRRMDFHFDRQGVTLGNIHWTSDDDGPAGANG